ncbi:MAG: hypothetical protein HKM06_08795 [Spirochaetales bacterium]|nr:hypothetical protein [Spirochaetales bacterium]
MRMTFTLLVYAVLTSCAQLPPPRSGASFLTEQPLGFHFSPGGIHCGNPLLPSPESLQAASLVRVVAEKNGFQIKEGAPESVELDYNEVDYDLSLETVHSLTAFLTLRNTETQKILATVFVSEDSGRTLDSWSVLYSLVDSLFKKLHEELDQRFSKP